MVPTLKFSKNRGGLVEVDSARAKIEVQAELKNIIERFR